MATFITADKVPTPCINWPSVYWCRVDQGIHFSRCCWSIMRELINGFVQVIVVDEPITGMTVYESNCESVRRFQANEASFMLRFDADQEMPEDSLARMIDAAYGGADLVTLHACLRHDAKRAFEYGGPWREHDNHQRDGQGTQFFSIAAALFNRTILTKIDFSQWQPHCKLEPYGDAGTGENWIVRQVLTTPGVTHMALDIVSPHHELHRMHGVPSDFAADNQFNEKAITPRQHAGAHGIRVYPANATP